MLNLEINPKAVVHNEDMAYQTADMLYIRRIVRKIKYGSYGSRVKPLEANYPGARRPITEKSLLVRVRNERGMASARVQVHRDIAKLDSMGCHPMTQQPIAQPIGFSENTSLAEGSCVSSRTNPPPV